MAWPDLAGYRAPPRTLERVERQLEQTVAHEHRALPLRRIADTLELRLHRLRIDRDPGIVMHRAPESQARAAIQRHHWGIPGRRGARYFQRRNVRLRSHAIAAVVRQEQAATRKGPGRRDLEMFDTHGLQRKCQRWQQRVGPPLEIDA